MDVMTDSDDKMPLQRRKPGPAATGKGVPVLVRLQPELLVWVDSKRSAQDPALSRPEMIRAILEGARGKDAP